VSARPTLSDLEQIIRDDVSTDIHFDLHGVERAAECIMARFDAYEAAAPDLLEALKASVEDLVQLSRARWSEMECTEDELVGEYRAVIAKAEGQ
jgi:hypothetical protein